MAATLRADGYLYKVVDWASDLHVFFFNQIFYLFVHPLFLGIFGTICTAKIGIHLFSTIS